MQHVGPCGGEEASGDAVGGHNDKADDGTCQVVPGQKGFKSGASGVNLGGDVNQHKQGQGDGGSHPQHMGIAAKTPHQVIDHSDGVIVVCQGFEASGHQEPHDGDPQQFADNNPVGGEADHGPHTGQAQQ